MSLYKTVYNPHTQNLTLVRADSVFHVKDSVDTYNSLPTTANAENNVRITQDTDFMYTWGISASSGILSDWKKIGSASEIDWSAINNKPTSAVEDIDDAVTKKHANTPDHTQDTDQKLDEGGGNEVSAGQAKDGYDHSVIISGNPHSVTASEVDSYTKAESDELCGGVNLAFYLSDDADDVINDYNKAYVSPASLGVEETITVASVSTDATLIKEFITEAGEPGITNLIEGVYNCHIHANVSAVSGNKLIQLYFEIHKRVVAGGAETLLITSEVTADLAVSSSPYVLHATLANDVTLLADDRIVLKIYANVDGVTSNPDVNIYVEGNTASRFSISTTLDVIDSRYTGKAPSITENNLIAFDASGDAKDSSVLTADVADAVTKKHTQGADTDITLTEEPANESATGIKVPLTAGENLSFGDVGYIKSDGKIWKGDANAEATSSVVVMALASINADATGSFLVLGIARNDGWAWTPGALLYLSGTAGELTETAPSASGDQVQIVAVATHADRILFKPSLVQAEVS